MRKLVVRTLVSSGYEVDAARDGADAWKALNEANYFLLITDHQMPRVTGLELIARLRTEDKPLPVILVSAEMPTEEINRHPHLHIDATLTKPFTAEVLLATVRKVLSTSVETPALFAAAISTHRQTPDNAG